MEQMLNDLEKLRVTLGEVAQTCDDPRLVSALEVVRGIIGRTRVIRDNRHASAMDPHRAAHVLADFLSCEPPSKARYVCEAIEAGSRHDIDTYLGPR